MFTLTLYSLYTEVMLILILINVQYLQNVVFSFEKGSNGQSHTLSDSYHLIQKVPREDFPLFFNTIWKTLSMKGRVHFQWGASLLVFIIIKEGHLLSWGIFKNIHEVGSGQVLHSHASFLCDPLRCMGKYGGPQCPKSA